MPILIEEALIRLIPACKMRLHTAQHFKLWLKQRDGFIICSRI